VLPYNAAADGFLLLNAHQSGFFRVLYDDRLLSAIVDAVSQQPASITVQRNCCSYALLYHKHE
jgi:hypothetical protein